PVVLPPCAFLLHTGLWVHLAPGFPCALCSGEGHEICKAQAKSRRENEHVCLMSPRASSPGLTGRPSIPETLMIEPRGRGVLDHPHARVMTSLATRSASPPLRLRRRAPAVGGGLVGDAGMVRAIGQAGERL